MEDGKEMADEITDPDYGVINELGTHLSESPYFLRSPSYWNRSFFLLSYSKLFNYVKESTLPYRKVKQGVSQGGVLSPIPFNMLFLNILFLERHAPAQQSTL